MRTSWLLILLALPSLIGSVLLMRLAGVGQSLLIQQIALALLGLTCVLWIDNAPKSRRGQSFDDTTASPQFDFDSGPDVDRLGCLFRVL